MISRHLARFVSPRRNRAALRGLARRLTRNRRGVAIVEFAFVLPVLLIAYFGLVDVGQGVMAERKVTELNRALADLTSSANKAISNDEMTNIFNAASMVMAPFTTVAPQMIVASITIDAGGVAKVCWVEKRNSSSTIQRGDTITVPADLKIANTALIMATTTYAYTPTVGYVLTGTFNIGNDPIYMRARLGKAGGTNNIEQVERSGVALCPNYS